MKEESLRETSEAATRVVVFIKKTVLKNFAIFTCEYCKIFKTTYFEEHLQTAASETKTF